MIVQNVYREDIWKKLLQVKNELVDTCTKCGGTGYVSTDTDTSLCKCMLVFKYVQRLIQAEIPIEYWTLYYKDLQISEKYIDVLGYYIERLDTALLKSKGILLIGANGIGKTAMLCEIAKFFLVKGITVKYTTADYYLSALKDNNTIFVKDYEDAEVHIFDEVGKSYQKKGSDYAMTKIEEYLRRASANKVLLSASNFEQRDLIDLLGESAMSVITGHLSIINVTGKDFRKSMQEDWMRDLDEHFDYYHENILRMAQLNK